MGMTAVVYFQSVRSYYSFYLHSELHKAEPALCDGRSMCCTLWHFGVLTCVCVCVCVFTDCPCPGTLCPSCPNMPGLGFYPNLFDPHPPSFSSPHILHLLSPSPPLVSGCPSVPLPCPFLLSPPCLPLFCSLILLPQSHFIASPFYLHPSSYSFFLTALGKLVDLVSPARTQWSPACCPGNTGRSLTNSILSKEWKDKDWRRAGRMTFFLIWGMFIKHKSRPASGGQSWSTGQRQEVRPEGN